MDFEIFDNFSKRSIKYDEEEIRDLWNNTKNKSNGLTIGTLIMMLQKDDPIAYQEIKDKYSEVVRNWTEFKSKATKEREKELLDIYPEEISCDSEYSRKRRKKLLLNA